MRLLSMFLLLLPLLLLPQIRPQSIASRSLDVILQDYAYRAFLNPRTGTVYDGEVPFNLTGIKIAALRLRSGSLFSRGVSSYKEFEIPTGVYEQPYVERLALVYHNLANWSSTYYTLSEYTYLTPVLGLLAYDAANLSAKNLPELNISASDKPILIRFNQVNIVPDGATVKCVRFDLDGLPHFSNLTARNVCSTTQQGHFSIVVEGIVPSSAPVLPPPTAKGPPIIRGGDKDNNKSKVWIIVGAVVGGVALLVLLSLLLCCLRRYKHTNKMQQMEKAARVGEALHMTSVGDTRAPVAMGTRTQPVLENEYVP